MLPRLYNVPGPKSEIIKLQKDFFIEFKNCFVLFSMNGVLIFL